MKGIQTRKVLIEIITAAFVLLFLYTAIMKFRDLRFFEGSMSHTPLIRPYRHVLSWLIPSIEGIIVLLLLMPQTRIIGLVSATILMGAFTIYVFVILSTMNELPCSCGGVLQRMNWKQHFVFNAAFFLAGLTSLLLHKQVIAINRSSRTPGNIVGTNY